MVDMSSFEIEGANFDDAPWIYIHALMLFPDPAKRTDFLNAMKARALKDVMGELANEPDAPGLGAALAFWTIEYASRWDRVFAEATTALARGAKGAEGSALHGGPLAGLTLLIPLIIWRKDQSQRPGRGAAYRVLSHEIRSGASERALQNNWMRFRNVAHLWATFILLDGWPNCEREIMEFIALSRQIRDEAGGYTPARDREPLLPLHVSLDLEEVFPALRASSGWVDHIEMPAKWLKIAVAD